MCVFIFSVWLLSGLLDHGPALMTGISNPTPRRVEAVLAQPAHWRLGATKLSQSFAERGTNRHLATSSCDKGLTDT
jgi:hypothetical protein